MKPLCLVVALSLAVLVGCGGGSQGSHPNRIASITITPATANITVGQTQQFSGYATTNSGATITGSGATWASSDQTVASVDQNGLATAVGSGTTTITATVQTGGGPVVGNATLAVTGPPPLTMQAASLPVGVVGSSYGSSLQASGGVPPYSWSVSAGPLPAGLNLNGATIAGIPTAAGAFFFAIQVTDSTGVAATSLENINVANATQSTLTGVTVYPDSTDSQYATITSSDGSQIDIWGLKDSTGMPTGQQSIQIQLRNGSGASYEFDNNGNLLHVFSSDRTLVSFDWQNATTANVVAYLPDGTSLTNGAPFTVSASAIASAQTMSRMSPARAAALPDVSSLLPNNFVVQVSRCGQPVFDGNVQLNVSSAKLSFPPRTVFSLPNFPVPGGTVYPPGQFVFSVPVAVPSTVTASAVSMCNAVANDPVFNLISSTYKTFSKTQTVLMGACYALAGAAYSAGPFGVPLAAEIVETCTLDLTAWEAAETAYDAGDLVKGNESSLQDFCNTTIPNIANSINSSDPLNIQTKIQVTGVSPVYIPSATTSTTYPGTGPFPGIGGMPPLSYNFNTLGLCALAGTWGGSWSYVGAGSQHRLHQGELSAIITLSTSVSSAYDIQMIVTDSHGTTSYSFPGVLYQESPLGAFFTFGPAAIDGQTGWASGYLGSSGLEISGSFKWSDGTRSGTWLLQKQ
jgi:hypothetical protein